MRLAFFSLLLVAASSLNTGVSGALTQNFMNYVIGKALPVGLDFLRKYPLPNPIASGDKSSISWKVYDGQLISVNADAKVTLVNPNVLQLTVYNFALDVKAKVHAREDIWPHPSITAKAEAKTSGATATAALAVVLTKGVPQVSLASCTLNMDLKISITGLGIFDKIADWIVKGFRGKIQDLIRKELCDDLLANEMVKSFLNPFLASFKYEFPLPIAAPFNKAIMDYHLTQTPDIYNGYLRISATGEVFSADGHHDPDPVAPLPVVSPSVWASKMVSVEVGPLPFDSTVWTFYSQKLLTYTAKKSTIPSALQPILNTAFYKTLMPKLYEAFPNADLQVVMYAASQPKFQMLQGHLTASCNLSYAFQVEKTGQLAFDLWSPFQVTLHASIKGNYLIGGLDNVTVTLSPGNCPYGIVGPDIISALSHPVNAIVNLVLIPILDAFVAQGIELPSFVQPLGKVAIVYGNFVAPELIMNAGYVMVATNVNLTIVEKKTGMVYADYLAMEVSKPLPEIPDSLASLEDNNSNNTLLTE